MCIYACYYLIDVSFKCSNTFYLSLYTIQILTGEYIFMKHVVARLINFNTEDSNPNL